MGKSYINERNQLPKKKKNRGKQKGGRKKRKKEKDHFLKSPNALYALGRCNPLINQVAQLLISVQ